MQASRRRRNGDGVLDTVTTGERTLKCSDFGTLRDPTALDRLAQRLPFLIAHARRGDGNVAFQFVLWHIGALMQSATGAGPPGCHLFLVRRSPLNKHFKAFA